MRFVTTKGEKTLTDLAARIFKIPAGDTARLKQAEAALLKANPQLANVQNLPHGTPVVAPESPGLSAAATSGPLESAAAAAAQELVQRLPQLSTALDQSLSTEMNDVKTTAGAMQNQIVRAAAANNPAFKEQLGRVEADLEARSKDADAVRGVHARLRAQLEEDLNNVVKWLG